MSRKSLWKLTVGTSTEAEEAVTEALSEIFGVATVTHHNTLTGRTSVSLFCKRRGDLSRDRLGALRARLREVAASGLAPGSGRVVVKAVRSEDWTTSWKRHFKPWEPGPALLVKPSWSRRKPARGQAVMILDPGLSFGTGNHPTTRFCLKQLVRLRRAGTSQSLLDAGSGSGILAIGATLLGYGPVEAFDFDPEAVRVARDNAARNGIAGRLKITRQDLTRLPLKPARRFDVVCANLMHDLLIAERRRILGRVAPGGSLLLAGILVAQFKEVQAAFEKEGWLLQRGRTEGEWRSGWFRRRE